MKSLRIHQNLFRFTYYSLLVLKEVQELAHSQYTLEILWSVLFGVVIACAIPLYTFFILKRKLTIEDSGAIAAAYGSVSAVTFVTPISFLDFLKSGRFTTAFAILIPLINGCLVALLSGLVTSDVGNRFIFAVLAASASYIAVPAAMKIAAPKANPGIYLPMALAITFPFNITIGLPVYLSIITFS